MQPYPPSPTGGNPFDDGNTNPFLTPPAKTKSAQEQEVEIILTSQEGQSTGTVFGSPVSAGSSASPKASVGAHSDTATRHATPSNVRNPAIAGPVAISPPRGGAWKSKLVLGGFILAPGKLRIPSYIVSVVVCIRGIPAHYM